MLSTSGTSTLVNTMPPWHESQAYIERTRGRLVVRRSVNTDTGYVQEKARNWEELEEEVWQALRGMETPASGVVYPCPSQLARKALFIQGEDSDWISLADARRISGRGHNDVALAISSADLDVKVQVDYERRKSKRLVRRSQVEKLWPRPRYITQWLGSRLRELREKLTASGESTSQAALVEMRFWDKADAGSSSVCWLWKGARSGSGYGNFWYKGRARAAHRVAYELAVGPIPEGSQVRRSCGSYLCVNPAHMMLVENRRSSSTNPGQPK